jgi:hypothetical protein
MFSQLFVRPNPSSSTDSYVYVSDEILFVEQDINLEKNTNNADTRASIYLRDEGQLIQGATASDNSGTGMLSVQQNNPGSDAWDYTYWCAPVGAQYLGATGNQNYSIQRIFESTGLTSATVSNFTANYNGFNDPKLTISKRWIYTHTAPGTEAEGAYQHVGQWHNIPPGYGFTMKGVNNGTTIPNGAGSGAGNHDQNYDFRGRPNNGTFNYTVGENLMTLVGNPYPSAIDMADVVMDNPNVSTIWYYDEDRDIDSHYYTDKRYGYGSWVPSGGASILAADGGGTEGVYAAPTFREYDASGGTGGGGTGGTGANYQRRFAPIGQGFMLIGNGNGTTAFINNSMREFRKESEGNSTFRNNESNSNIPSNGGWWDDEDPDPISERVPELRIVTKFQNSQRNNQREMVLLFHNDATDNYDHGMDGMHPMDAPSEIYFPITHNGEKSPYVIQTVPFDINKSIPVTIKVNFNTKIGIKIVDEINFNEIAYIHDLENDSFHPINDQNIAKFILSPGLYEDRFFIVFKDRNDWWRDTEGTIVKEETKASLDFFQNNPLKQLEIRNPEGYNIKSAMVYDMAGKLVINKTNLGNNSIITLPTSNVSDGVYLVQLVTSENINIDYKMVIKNN